MDLTWIDAAQAAIAGLAGVLGIHLVEGGLETLRRHGLCPQRWNR